MHFYSWAQIFKYNKSGVKYKSVGSSFKYISAILSDKQWMHTIRGKTITGTNIETNGQRKSPGPTLVLLFSTYIHIHFSTLAPMCITQGSSQLTEEYWLNFQNTFI